MAADVAPTTWALVAYVVVVPTLFTYLTNAWALRFASSATVAIYVYIQPTIAAVLAWYFLDEQPSGRLVVAALLVFAGIWVVTRAPAVVPVDGASPATPPP